MTKKSQFLELINVANEALDGLTTGWIANDSVRSDQRRLVLEKRLRSALQNTGIIIGTNVCYLCDKPADGTVSNVNSQICVCGSHRLDLEREGWSNYHPFIKEVK